MAGKPFQSRFIPHAAAIAAQRRGGRTWQEIAARLTREGCPADPGNLCRFFARWKRRPYALGAEPEPEPQTASVPPAAVRAKTPAPVSSRPPPAAGEDSGDAAEDLAGPAPGASFNPWGA